MKYKLYEIMSEHGAHVVFMTNNVTRFDAWGWTMVEGTLFELQTGEVIGDRHFKTNIQMAPESIIQINCREMDCHIVDTLEIPV